MKLIAIERTSGVVLALFLLVTITNVTLSQQPTPTPDQRGLGIQSPTSRTDSQTGQQPREAKPELVLQTGYNSLSGATRFVFSPDGRPAGNHRVSQQLDQTLGDGHWSRVA
jgi:hypothetical protein